MNELNDDRKVIEEGRAQLLTPAEQTTSIRDQIVHKLFDRLEEMEIGKRVSSLWYRANIDRTTWLDRQIEYLSQYDEFIDTEPSQLYDSSSSLHIPMTLWALKAYHARFLQVMFNPEPSMSLKARKAGWSDLAPELEDLVKYALMEWANYRQGIEEPVDQWLWSWLSTGIGYTKWRWDCQYKKYVDVVETTTQGPIHYTTDSEGNQQMVPTTITKEQEVIKIDKTFEGPVYEFIPIEDIVVVGKDMVDIDGADAVIHRQFLTASDLWLLAEQKIFDEKAVEATIASGDDSESRSDSSSGIKVQRASNAGDNTLDKEYDLDRYEILEAYLSIDTDGTGINSDVIVWVHNKTNTLLRATYLHRMSKSGARPIQAIMFHKRSGMNKHMPIGLVEMLYPIQKELDAIHNMRMDNGLISTCPFGFYRASSSLNPKSLKLTPGVLIPLDDPQRDVYFPQLGNRTSYFFQEEQQLYTFVERLIGLNDLNLSSMSGSQGATRTATGVQAITNESNTNLNTPLKRLNRGWKRSLEYVTHMIQKRCPPGLEFSVTGNDGLLNYKRVVNPDQLNFDFDIEISPTTEASNKTILINNSTQILQVTQNPLYLQMGIITPVNVYEALKNYLKVMGVKDYSKFINSKFENQVVLTPQEEVQRTIAGQEITVLPTSDHAGVIGIIQHMFADDNQMGQLSQYQAVALQAQLQKHIQMQAAMQQMQANQSAAQQMQFNSSQGMSQAGQGAGAAPAQPTPIGGPQDQGAQ